jgi:AbrB family looped-hinge helix DNA binding protein
MAETTYYEDKVYLPKEIREKLGLVAGDVLHIEVVEKGSCYVKRCVQVSRRQARP